MTEKTTWILPNGTEAPLNYPGGLYLSRTGITQLPEGLSVGGDLYLSGTGITQLPEGFSINKFSSQQIKEDLFKILNLTQDEVCGLLAAIENGEVNGSTYEGRCACLVGTLANMRHCSYLALEGIKPDPHRPAERFFSYIKQGDKPDSSPFSRTARQWVAEWMDQHALTTP